MLKIVLMSCMAWTALAAVPAQKEPVIKQPVDQTDIFAIPFDEDEQSQDEELQEMEQHK